MGEVGKHKYELPLLVSAVLVDLVTGQVEFDDGFKNPTSSSLNSENLTFY